MTEATGSLDTAPFQAGFAVDSLESNPAFLDQVNFVSRAQALTLAVRLAMKVPGHVMEFGVASGASTRIIRRLIRRARWNPFIPHANKRIFACDSFEGLSETFEGAEVGAFAGAVPKIGGVTFVKGYFDRSLTENLRREVGRVAFAHLDADLYSSTKTVLAWLTPLLDTGSLLLFDEFTGEHESERRAFDEWRQAEDITVVRIAEFDRDPSGFGRARPDRRVLFQVIGRSQLSFKPPRSSPRWQIAYYLDRLGLAELKSRFETWCG